MKKTKKAKLIPGMQIIWFYMPRELHRYVKVYSCCEEVTMQDTYVEIFRLGIEKHREQQ